jgi:hypothetical protein
MPRGKYPRKKDKFADIPEEFKDAVAGMNEAEVRDRIAQVSLDNAALQAAKALDMDYKAARDQARVAGAVYRDGAKANKLKIEFCRQRLGDLCKPNGDVPEVP